MRNRSASATPGSTRGSLTLHARASHPATTPARTSRVQNTPKSSENRCSRSRVAVSEILHWQASRAEHDSLYALEVGLGLARVDVSAAPVESGVFLCPRCRAGVSK